MPFGTSRSCSCIECGLAFQHGKRLSEHIRTVHKLDPIGYVVKHMHAGKRPGCLSCGQETRFVSLLDGFKRWCPEHRSLAESLGGKIGGRVKKNGSHAPAFFIPQQHPPAPAPVLSVPLRVVPSSVVSNNVPVPPSPAPVFDAIQVAAFVRSLGFSDVVVYATDVISPLTLDVWIPSKRLAIECHELDWNVSQKPSTFVKGSQREKLERCRLEGIRLMQFFSDEWRDKGDTCRSIIENGLGVNAHRLHARDCIVATVPVATSKAFAAANHVSGSTRASHHIGLYHKKLGLVGLVTTRTPIQKKWGHVTELARMCFLHGTSVRGGASKLLSHVKVLAIAEGFEGILSYAELRFGTGNVYPQCGFTKMTEALNNYGYTDGQRRYDRFKFRAQEGKSEKQVIEEAGVRSVVYAGNAIFIWKP